MCGGQCGTGDAAQGLRQGRSEGSRGKPGVDDSHAGRGSGGVHARARRRPSRGVQLVRQILHVWAVADRMDGVTSTNAVSVYSVERFHAGEHQGCHLQLADRGQRVEPWGTSAGHCLRGASITPQGVGLDLLVGEGMHKLEGVFVGAHVGESTSVGVRRSGRRSGHHSQH